MKSHRVKGSAVKAGDVLHLNDWILHVERVSEAGLAVGVAEFGFLLHLAQDKDYEVIDTEGE